MGAVPSELLDPGMGTDPNGDPQADAGAAYMQNVTDAYNQGYSYSDLIDHHDALGMDPPPRPSLDAITSNVGTGQGYTMDQLQQPGIDKINEGAGVIGETILGLGAGSAVGAVRGALASGVLTDISGELAPAASAAADSISGWIHGSDAALSTDMMQAGKSLWLTQNPGVAKNVGNILHDVELRPGAIEDVTDQLVGKTSIDVQQSMYDLVQKYQWDNPSGARYLKANIPDTGDVLAVLNQRRDVLNIARRGR